MDILKKIGIRIALRGQIVTFYQWLTILILSFYLGTQVHYRVGSTLELIFIVIQISAIMFTVYVMYRNVKNDSNDMKIMARTMDENIKILFEKIDEDHNSKQGG